MQCSEIRNGIVMFWEEQQPPEVREHLAGCAACSRYYLDLRLMRSGFRLLKSDQPVTPSLGFAARMVRQLAEIGKAPNLADFLERIGRRFVYAGLVLTLLAILAMALPSMGPVRGLSAGDIQMQEATLSYSDPVGLAGVQETADVAPTQPAPSVQNEGK